MNALHPLHQLVTIYGDLWVQPCDALNRGLARIKPIDRLTTRPAVTFIAHTDGILHHLEVREPDTFTLLAWVPTDIVRLEAEGLVTFEL